MSSQDQTPDQMFQSLLSLGVSPTEAEQLVAQRFGLDGSRTPVTEFSQAELDRQANLGFGEFGEVGTQGAPELANRRDEFAEVNTGGGVPYPGGTGPTEPTRGFAVGGGASGIPYLGIDGRPDDGSNPTVPESDSPVGDGPPGSDTPGTPGTPESESPPLRKSILSSPTLKWYTDAATGLFYASYGLPGSDRELVFEATPEQMLGLFPDGEFPPTTSVANLRVLLSRPGVTYGGDVFDMEGEGSFEDHYNRIIALSLDEGRLPDWAVASPEVMDILFTAASEDKSDDWVLNQIATTAAFETRFPGLNALRDELGGSVEDSVASFLELEMGVKTLEARFGGNMASVTPDTVGALLTHGYNLSDIELSYQVFERYEANQDALLAFNEVLVANGAPAMSEDEMFEFLEGTAPMEIYDLYEAASFREGATAEGVGEYLDPAYALQLAEDTPGMVQLSEIRRQLQQSARQILLMRADLDLDRYGVDHEDLVDLSLGVTPRSGTTIAELGNSISRLNQEAEAFLQDRKRPFYSFTKTGRPQAASLSERPNY